MTINFNADVGEGFNNESKILPFLQSCSIACGGHAGSISTMKQVTALAIEHNVKIGAHPSFPDRINFGREVISIPQNVLYESLVHQIQSLRTILHQNEQQLDHIKPHGSLYNLVAKDVELAKLFINMMLANFEGAKLYAPHQSVIAKIAEKNGIEVCYEAFADRAYNSDLSLVSRSEPNAVLKTEAAILKQVTDITKGTVDTIEGYTVAIKADTICFHGDHPKVVDNLKFVSESLKT